MIFLKCMVYQLSPSANMNVRDGRITFQDVFLSYENSRQSGQYDK